MGQRWGDERAAMHDAGGYQRQVEGERAALELVLGAAQREQALDAVQAATVAGVAATLGRAGTIYALRTLVAHSQHCASCGGFLPRNPADPDSPAPCQNAVCGPTRGAPGGPGGPPMAPAVPPPMEAARRYHHRFTAAGGGVAAEQAALPAPDDPAFDAAVAQARYPETAAWAVRALLRAGARDRARRAGDRWGLLIAPYLVAAARQASGGDDEAAADLAGGAALQLWRDLADLGAGQEFITYNAPVVARRAVWQQVRRGQRQRQHERRFRPAAEPDGLGEEEQLADAAGGPEEAVLRGEGGAVGAALAGLPAPVRQAMLLIAQGVPIEDRPHPQNPYTVAHMMGVSGRTIRTWRNRAAAVLVQAGLGPPA